MTAGCDKLVDIGPPQISERRQHSGGRGCGLGYHAAESKADASGRTRHLSVKPARQSPRPEDR